MEIWDGLYAALAVLVGAVLMCGACGAVMWWGSKGLAYAVRVLW